MGLCPISFFIGCIVFKNRCARKSEKLGLWKKFLDCRVIFTELRAVTFVKNKNDPFVSQGVETFSVFLFPALRQGQTQFLNGGDDDLIRIVIR